MDEIDIFEVLPEYHIKIKCIIEHGLPEIYIGFEQHDLCILRSNIPIIYKRSVTPQNTFLVWAYFFNVKEVIDADRMDFIELFVKFDTKSDMLKWKLKNF